MPVWLWFVIGFAILLAFGAIVDQFGKRNRRANPTEVHQGVDQVKSNKDTFYR
ncbi:hypothetical protein FIU87_02205 [Bacillus sp. THAF10]|uniref:hypothetical protein n=1 Tax=Bacillus sp. THAF10 TaxID=2587848 RepID=UPI0012A84BFF|nr:hypothetical protein [Bacillus sp. THAF10]QFT87451.1 hypothetical protein FIU87_02205 [Bacillus sp. THAF10]